MIDYVRGWPSACDFRLPLHTVCLTLLGLQYIPLDSGAQGGRSEWLPTHNRRGPKPPRAVPLERSVHNHQVLGCLVVNHSREQSGCGLF